MLSLKKRQTKFHAVLAEAVQEGLNSIGPSISDAVFFYVQKKTSIRVDYHALDPHAFDSCLKEIFWCGAEIIEKRVLECLYAKLESPMKFTSGFTFVEEVRKAERLLDSPSSLRADALRHKRGKLILRF